MTEYIIIVALIAISAIVVYNLFGSTVREQVGDMAAELGTLTRQQVLAQASQALRSQAAALPRQVLGILLGAGSGTS